jgi:uncharacterized protein YecE (DUF72 family)
MAEAGRIRAGIGGWTFEPWRGVFYPAGLKQADELAYAASHLTAIEINGTYYSSFKPDSWAKWRAATPEGFKFAVKASRFCTNRKILGEMGESMGRFLGQGLVELGDRLGPILWQFMGTKKFDPDGVTVCLADHFEYPLIPDVTGAIVYARLQTGSDDTPTAYPPEKLDLWADRFKSYAGGGRPDDLPAVDPAAPAPKTPRDVYAFVIHEGKVRAPAAAMALIERVRG